MLPTPDQKNDHEDERAGVETGPCPLPSNADAQQVEMLCVAPRRCGGCGEVREPFSDASAEGAVLELVR